MISIKSEREIELMRIAGHINYLTHQEIKKHIRAGITTGELNDIADKFIREHDALPSCLNYEGFPKSICISVNDEVVHGIPGNRKLKNGDIVSVDFCVEYKGYQSDSAMTHIVGSVSKEVEDLVENTKKSLYIGINAVKAGAKVSDIGAAIEKYAKSCHLGVVRELVGHGLGTSIHEDPDVPNYYTNMPTILKEGMVIAIEPMLTLGKRYIYMKDDDWTIATDDGLPAAHFEHTVLVTKEGYEILTGEWYNNMAKKNSDKIEVEGKVVEVLKGSDYLVELPNGHTVKAYVSGKMRIHMIRILPGDTVTVELSPYDLTRGIITWNKR